MPLTSSVLSPETEGSPAEHKKRPEYLDEMPEQADPRIGKVS